MTGNDDKKLTASNANAIDDDLLSQLFEPSVAMNIADDGFSEQVMERITGDVSERQWIIYNVWSAVLMVAGIALFFILNGVELLRNSLQAICGDMAVSLRDTMARLMPAEWLHLGSFSYTTPLLVGLAALVLSSVFAYDAIESEN